MRPELYSGKHKTTAHAHQFVCDFTGDLLHSTSSDYVLHKLSILHRASTVQRTIINQPNSLRKIVLNNSFFPALRTFF
jgi:hypothetical protein